MMAADSARTSPTREWTIRAATDRADVFFLMRQQHHYFGDEYAANRLPRELAELLGWPDEDADGRPLDALGLVAAHGEVAVGGAFATIDTHDVTVEMLPDGPFSNAALAGERNGWLRLNVVDPAWRGRGIGHALFDARLDWLAARDPDMVFAFGWERDAGRSSRPLFEAHEFTPIHTFERYYARGKHPRDSCPDCGAWPSNDADCQCATTLWALDSADLQRIATRQTRQTTSDCYEADQ
ncbi:GNAT family N-acetyltransferase [Haloarcula sp. JP-L23]|uniref:GNAT family N-acetyltransferase n=1 Tax=Haloarcula sp. JP-L23 TaxID=2716717 RepID=UPI00140EBFBE|nr:GNAT family N-acetyltransferase [Haloarcula sp. JP-L23]